MASLLPSWLVGSVSIFAICVLVDILIEVFPPDPFGTLRTYFKVLQHILGISWVSPQDIFGLLATHALLGKHTQTKTHIH